MDNSGVMDVHFREFFQYVQHSTIGMYNLPSTINRPNGRPPALLIFEKNSKNSHVMDVLRENIFLKLLQTFQKLCEV